MQQVFLVDLDNTLLDTEQFRDLDYKNITTFKEYLFPKAIEFLKLLQEIGEVFIYTNGEKDFQFTKINTTGINKIVSSNNIMVVDNKEEDVVQIIKDFTSKGFKVTIIDDRITVLENAHKTNSKIKCIWIKYGKYSDITNNLESLSYRANSLDDVYKYFSLLKDYKIENSLTENQIDQLIQFTHEDEDVQKFTSDLKRFKDKETFKNWIKKRELFALIDSNNNLAGILWFTKEEFDSFKSNPHYSKEDYPYTFGIRMYGTARGKGLAKTFMQICFKDFGKKGVWLTTDQQNLPAIKLYTNFGFVQIPDENPYGKLVMLYKKQ